MSETGTGRKGRKKNAVNQGSVAAAESVESVMSPRSTRSAARAARVPQAAQSTSRATSAAPAREPIPPPQNRHPPTLWSRIRAQAEKYLFQFEVTVGLYMLDWWERQVFYVVALSLIWFLSYQTYRYCERTFQGLPIDLNLFRLRLSGQQRPVVNGAYA